MKICSTKKIQCYLEIIKYDSSNDKIDHPEFTVSILSQLSFVKKGFFLTEIDHLLELF